MIADNRSIIGWAITLSGFMLAWFAKSGWIFQQDSIIMLVIGVVLIVIGVGIAIFNKDNKDKVNKP